jgi:plasmid stabilization system protein ParE
MYRCIILPKAEYDIKEAADWYNGQQKGLGKRFAHEVRTTVKFVCRDPETIALRYDNVRCAITEVFPFMVHFTIDEFRKTIILIAVLHTSRNPQEW